MPEHSTHSRLPRPLVVVHGSLADRDLYEKWDAMRLAVFGVELGWQLASRSPGALEPRDPCDEHAIFFAGLSRGSVIAIVRALSVGQAFPHRELFETHLRRSDLHRHLSVVWTLNALAVVPSRRRTVFVRAGGGRIGTAAGLLLSASLERIAAAGGRVVLATVLSAASAKAFIRAGFSLLDVPVAGPGHQDFLLANVGMVLSAPVGQHDAPADVSYFRQCRQYFDGRHSEVMAGTSIDALFATPAHTNRVSAGSAAPRPVYTKPPQTLRDPGYADHPRVE